MEESKPNAAKVSKDKDVEALWGEIDELRAKIEQKLIVFLARQDIPNEIKELFKR